MVPGSGAGEFSRAVIQGGALAGRRSIRHGCRSGSNAAAWSGPSCSTQHKPAKRASPTFMGLSGPESIQEAHRDSDRRSGPPAVDARLAPLIGIPSSRRGGAGRDWAGGARPTGRTAIILSKNARTWDLEGAGPTRGRVIGIGVQVIPIAQQHGLLAADLSLQHGLPSGDALIAAVMHFHRLTSLASNDSDFERVPGIVRYAPIA